MDPEGLDRCRRALALAAPSADTGTRTTQGGRLRGGEWPRLDLIGTRSVQYAYLLPSEESAELRIFPGDTLTQARELYSDPARVESLLGLRSRGWRLSPNMHFGFAARGFAWMKATASIEAYVDYWKTEISETGQLERQEWPRFLSELLRLGFASPGDEAAFVAAFTETSRQRASPRPAIAAYKQLRTPLGQVAALGEEVAGELRQALTALREPLTTLTSKSTLAEHRPVPL